jgi:hypothetical protein
MMSERLNRRMPCRSYGVMADAEGARQFAAESVDQNKQN